MTKKTERIGITGACGFLGSKISDALRARKYEVAGYDLNNMDIRSKFAIPSDIDVLYHMAAINKPYLSKINPSETFKTNVAGMLNLLEAVKDSNVKKIIFTSSILVYKDLTKTKETDAVGYNNIYPYGLEKLIGEEYLKIYAKLYGFDYVILRLSGVYGPGMVKNPVFDIIQGFINKKIKLYVNRNSVYNFIYINDVVDALIKSLEWRNETINLCSDENVKIIDICQFFKEKTKEIPEIADEKTMIKILGDNKKIKKMGWKVNFPLKKGLIEAYNYFENKNGQR